MPPKGGWRSKTRSVPGSDLENKTLGTGNPTSQDKSAGRQQNARFSSVNLTPATPLLPVGTVLEYDVPHDLGKVPTVVTLARYENASGPVTITARGVRDSGWSHSHVFVEVTLLAGSLDATVATFLVRGK